MRLPIACMQCSFENIPRTSIYDFTTNLEINDNGKYITTCKNGHTSLTFLQQQKFEILFEIGAYAIIDGYYREAVSSFTAALERFYEFFVKTVCISKGNEYDEILNTWKKISNQSERQLGAYIFTYFIEFSEKPDTLSDKDSQFRNAVIHKGKIPTREESIKYGQTILNLIRPVLSQVQSRYTDFCEEDFMKNIMNRSSSEKELKITTLSIPTILSLTIVEPAHHERSLDSILEELRHHRVPI